ncbi:hypothetical protein OSB04_016433 [Centaurea solstitialis]|uniref:TIR domain-containing protein n=1 Tax=Centaurea solstitialis TaxID=347529 RepID=A0AA38T0Z1_9ASTR|nr:hypothetical protein OSB04_016433 [Centaurea solstitialis]
MASSSTSSIPTSFKYDVFLSFRGEDTRRNFIDHIYHALQQKNIHTYKDDERITKGKRISDELIRSIEDSKFYIVVFSKNYASSSWCLDELVKIMECQKTADHTAYPIFYDVEPSQVRRQTGAVGEAFAKHEKEEGVEKWREALEEAAALAGWELKNTFDGESCLDTILKDLQLDKTPDKKVKAGKHLKELLEMAEKKYQKTTALFAFKFQILNLPYLKVIVMRGCGILSKLILSSSIYRHEAKFIQKIVEEISLELRSINFRVDGNLIGMETRIKDVVSSLEMTSDDVRMIGIKGMGGGGKTTLARYVFDQISIHFEGKSFVENVREVSTTTLSGLKLLQNQVLSDVLNDQSIVIDNVYDGKIKMKKLIGGRKVLVVLDDVDHVDQLEALAGEPNWFKPGSRILITTRDEQVLVAHRVNLIRDVNLLSHEEAICLFSRYAFGRDIPIQGYEGLSRQVVQYAAGLPLTIRVLGSFLCGKVKLEWHDAIERLKTIPLKETQEKLELSYIGLEEDYKEIFLDVACILKGRLKDIAINMLECCGFHARTGLKVLQQKSLITISEYGYLGMHDHLEEMGRNIVRRSHPLEPNRHSRLWIDEEIDDILANDSGTEATRCIQLSTSKLNPEIFMKGLGKMKKLRFLHMHSTSYENRFRFDWKFDEVSQYLPNNIQYLSWRCYPFWSLPKTFHANNLVALEMHDSNVVQLWEGGERKVLRKLRFLDLSYSKLKTLDLGLIPNLEKLSLKECNDLVELRMPAGCLKLESLHIKDSKLRTLDLGWTPNLNRLSLIGCYDLVELRMPGCPKLEFLHIMGSKLRALDLDRAVNLETLSLEECCDLVELLMPVGSLKLESLEIVGSKLRTLDFGSTPSYNIPVEYLRLASLDLTLSKLSTLDLGGTLNLETLSLRDCSDLVELHMPVEGLKFKHLNLNHSKLKIIDLGGTPNLETLSLRGCYELVELHMPECLELKYLNLSHSKLRKVDLGGTPNLETLSLRECYDLVELYMPVRCLKLEFLDIMGLKLRILDLGWTPNLKKLSCIECVELVELHIPVECLHLSSLNLSLSKLITLDLGGTLNLETIFLRECYDLVELHMPIECLKLIYLNLTHSKVRTLDLGGAPNLKTLSLRECYALVELQMPIERLMLESLEITGSKIMTLDLQRASSLKTLCLVECFDLVELDIPAKCLKLTSLHLSLSKLRTLDLRGTLNLETLTLDNCDDLIELRMPVECVNLKSFHINRSKLRTLDLGLTPHLLMLHLTECHHLVELHVVVGHLGHLSYLDLSGCCRFKSLFFTKQGYLEAIALFELHLIVESLDTCPLHPNRDMENLISKEFCACTNLERFSRSICGLRCLTKLTLEGSISEVPRDLDRLECLEELRLLSTKIKHLPDSICTLKHLKHLELNPCWLLEKLPEDLGQLECLEKLILSECVFLRDIPDSICKIKRLKYFRLYCCIGVEKLPEDLGRLKCLKELNIEGTNIRHLPQSIFELKGLRVVGFRWLLELCGFTYEIQTSENETFCYI